MRAGPDMHESYDEDTITLTNTYGSGTIIHSSLPADGTVSLRRRPWTVLLSVLTGALLLIPNLALAQGGDPGVNRLDPILRLGLAGEEDLGRLRLIAEEQVKRALERVAKPEVREKPKEEDAPFALGVVPEEELERLAERGITPVKIERVEG